jgi:hypothetical protein
MCRHGSVGTYRFSKMPIHRLVRRRSVPDRRGRRCADHCPVHRPEGPARADRHRGAGGGRVSGYPLIRSRFISAMSRRRSRATPLRHQLPSRKLVRALFGLRTAAPFLPFRIASADRQRQVCRVSLSRYPRQKVLAGWQVPMPFRV